WAPAGASGECFVNAGCAADASVGGPVGIDCRVPAAGPGVHCAGSQSPYSCTCDGESKVIYTTGEVPSASMLGALAVACGGSCGGADAAPSDASTSAVCPNIGLDASPSACEGVSPTCNDGHTYAHYCTTATNQCTCKVDGVETKVVTSDCGGAWDACGFPQ